MLTIFDFLDMDLKSRIIEFIKYKRLDKATFERIVGLSNDAVSKMGDNTRKSTIDKISSSFPELNTVWLRTGEGEMLKTGDIHIVGDGNLSNTGIAGGDIVMSSSQEVDVLKKRIKELEAEVKDLKNDKNLLHEFITLLQNKK